MQDKVLTLFLVLCDGDINELSFMIKIKALVELTAPDVRSLHFTPLGFVPRGKMNPEDSAQFLQQSIAASDLHHDVAEATRKSFERLQILHSYGVLFYEAFTIAADLAWLGMEQAFRERFVTYYNGTIPFRNGNGIERTLSVQDFNDVYEAVKYGDYRDKNWKLKVLSTGELMEFRGSLTYLLSWARNEGLLFGQRNKRLESLYTKMRNSTAHSNYSLVMPSNSAQAINHLGEVINHLWGHSTPGGHLYPTPLNRAVLVVAWNDNQSGQTHTQFRGDQLTEFNETGNWTCLVIRAVPDDDLFEFNAQFERTNFPSELLWGPGNAR